MFRFVYYSDIDYLYQQLALEKKLDVYEVLYNPENYIRKTKIETIYDIHEMLAQDSFFGDQLPDIIEMSGFKVDNETIEILKSIEVTDTVTIVDSNADAWLVDTKKKWQKVGFEYLELKKPDPSLQLSLAQHLNLKTGLNLAQSKVQELSAQATNYQEIIIWFDLLQISSNKALTLNEILKPQIPELYTVGFDLNRLSSTLNTWLELVNDDNLQLAMSLVYNKLDKQSHPKSKEALKLLIETDFNMKSMGKLDQLTHWKLFLYKVEKL